MKTAETDLYPFEPDLVIFHVYGSHLEYENIIRRIRERTTADVLLMTDHLSRGDSIDEPTDPDELTPESWSPWMNYAFLPRAAATYGAERADVRDLWKQYLRDHNLTPGDLLSDDVHLNDHGCYLMAEIVKSYLRRDPRFDADAPASDVERTYVVGRDVEWEDGTLALDFEGSRVVAVVGPGEGPEAPIAIDGMKPSVIPDLVALTRTTAYPGTKWPCLLLVGARSARVPEAWSLTFTELSDDLKAGRFRVEGSVTGPDGEGTLAEPFVSTSGRVAIEPADWNLEYVLRVFGKRIDPGFVVRWEVLSQSIDAFRSPGIADESAETTVTLARGLPNGPHRLEIRGGPAVPIRALRVSRPPLRPAAP